MATQSASLTDGGRSRPGAGRRLLLQLFVSGIVLEIVYLALYPLFIAGSAPNDPVRQALPGLLPWLPRLYWTNMVSPQLLARIPWFNPTSTAGGAHLLLLLLALAVIFLLLAARAGLRGLPAAQGRGFLWLTLLLTALFGVTMLCAPVRLDLLSRDMLLYGLYGRMVVIYHSNPYVVAPATLSHDLLQRLIAGMPGQQGPAAALAGPIWIDLSILVTLAAHDSIANMLLGFRLLALLAHLINALLIWLILARSRPELRLGATVFYAWNPLLLLNIAQVHLVVVCALFVLLAVLFLQRSASLVCWVFLLLAVLVNVFCLLLLPLFFRLLLRQTRFRPVGRRTLWWLGMGAMTLLLIALTYAPYWRGWGITGPVAALRQAFLPDQAINSLNAALQSLPLQLPAPVAWLADTRTWTIALLASEAITLLFALWLADTSELTLLCSGWLFLLLLIFHPIYWPWSMVLPLVLALCSPQRNTLLLTTLLILGALLSYDFLQWQPAWPGQGLIVVGLPLLLWGWIVFFLSLWYQTGMQSEERSTRHIPRLSRPPWLSRPSWPSRPQRK